MKNLSFLEKFIFLVNSILAVLFLISLVIPYIKPSIFPYFSILSLFSPLIILLNILFIFYWIAKLKKQFLLSVLILLIGYNSVLTFINFSNNSSYMTENKVSIISYNVRLFNLYNWIDENDIEYQINSFLVDKSPDIICLQEYRGNIIDLPNYPYRFEFLRGNNIKYGQVIFSKFPILNKGSVDFSSMSNNAIFVDLKIHNDTIRFYNVHLQSFALENEIDLSTMNTIQNKEIVTNLSNTFITQQRQVDVLRNSIDNSPYKNILSGDFNNTAFSYTYKNLINGFKDSFMLKGNGLGITFNYNFIPLRIDFILVDDNFRVNQFKTYKINLSDHEPIFSEFYF
tara:strand:- start:2477 stop:3499 length:1023 start_codon:yes stop_codon:yes gene_type:complete